MSITAFGNTGRWTLDDALAQIEKCGFECEGGPIENNVAFRWLRNVQRVAPKFLPGQQVFFEVSAEAGGVKMSQWSPFYVVGVIMDSDTEKRFYKYHLSNDPPAPWHYGSVQFSYVSEDSIRLCPPEPGE